MQDQDARRREFLERVGGRYDAEEIFIYLNDKAKAFENLLEDDEEMGVQLANFGVPASIHLRSLSFKNPNIIEFSGVDTEGNRLDLVQHISQLSFLFVALKPIGEKPYRAGFSTIGEGKAI